MSSSSGKRNRRPWTESPKKRNSNSKKNNSQAMLQLAEFAVNSFWIYCTLSVVVMVTLVTTLASCLCCRKQEIK